MNRLLSVLVFCCFTAVSVAQNCPNFNFPAELSDSCHTAPLLCGNYLDGYCGSNIGFSDDDFGQASGFLRFSTCFEEMALQVQVFNCTPGSAGLIFSVHEEDCNPQSVSLAIDTVAANTTDTISASNLDALTPLILAISGVQGSQCNFSIKVLEGIGTALPGPVDCQCSGGGIDGPGQICSHAAVSYKIEGLMCNFFFGLPIGGNGEYCPPAEACPSSLDSILITWHIPEVMHFVGDSTGPNVMIALDTNYTGLDTIRLDSVWVTWQLVSTTPPDSLAYCNCPDVSCDGGSLLVLPIAIGLEHEVYTCQITCAEPVCIVNGVEYTSPGVYSSVVGCTKIKVIITKKFEEPIIPTEFICAGESALLEASNTYPEFSYTWNTGETGTSFSVSPTVTTTYTLTAVHISGNCTFTSSALVVVTPFLQENLGEIGVVTCLQPCLSFQGNTYCQSGQFTVQVGNCHTQTFTIGSDPDLQQIIQPSVTICQGQCFDFFGQQICTSQTAFHTENCTTYVRQIIVEPRDTIYSGVVGTITCDAPCFTYNGQNYCAAGQYKLEDECSTTYFDIDYKKVVINLGTVDTISCKVFCVTYDSETYCLAGSYEKEDSCYIRKFSIYKDERKPEVNKPVLDCSPTNTYFTVAFEISGLPPFKVGEEELSGGFFLSDPIANGSNYAFIVKHDNGCETIVNGYYDCAQFCASDPGMLSGEVIHGCIGNVGVAIVAIQQPNLTPGDVLVYHLQDAGGQVVATSDSGAFTFDPATMQAEVTYMAACVVGPPDVNGLPNPTEACTDTSNTQPVVFHQAPTLSITGDSSLCEYDAIALAASGAINYLWSTGATGSLLVIPEATPDDSGWYKVRGSSEYGCFAEDSVLVEVFPSESKNCCKPQIPNAFTPNGDGANDSFVPLISDCTPLEYAEMRIYSRWGQLVFKSDEEQLRWDGTFGGGQPAGSDTYVFSFRYKLLGEMEKTESGEITLLR